MLANTIFEVIGFLEKPVLEKDKKSKKEYLFKKFLSLLFIVVTINVTVFSILMLYQTSEKIGMNEIAYQTSLGGISNIYFLITSILINPLIAEIIFRGFLHKTKKYFGILFYVSAILFGLYQFYYSYSYYDTIFLGFVLIFLTQFFSGLVLGFTRIRYGLLWSYGLNVLIHLVSEIILLSFLFL